MATPSSQKADARPISFLLTNDFTGEQTSVVLVIRPEDLQRREPSLMTTTKTLAGAFVDDWGPDLAEVTISGTTGWRGGVDGDGIQGWITLRDTVYVQWHAQRAAAIAAGQSPDVVKLIFSDALDELVSVVAPMRNVLKRNKSRPLLIMYEIAMVVLSDDLGTPIDDPLALGLAGASPSPDVVAAGITSLTSSVSEIAAASASALQFVDSSIVAPVSRFMALSTTAFNNVLSGLSGSNAAQLVGVASDLALVGRNAFFCMGAAAGLDSGVLASLSSVASSYENALCVLTNAFRAAPAFPDYSELYGASVCSSTIGGSPLSPLAGSNPFEAYLPAVLPPPSVTTAAKASIDTLKAIDPVLAPMDYADLGVQLDDISSGVSFS